MSRLLGYATTNFFHGKSPINLKTKDGREISFLDLCKDIIPTCQLNPFLFNGHLQTVWTTMKSEVVPLYYKRHIFEQEDPVYAGSFCVDFVSEKFEKGDDTLPPRTKYFTEDEFRGIGSDDTRPMLVALHGLSGGSYELYLRHVLAPLVGEGPEGGWEACVVTARGCAKHKMTTGIMFNARATWDVRQVVKWLRRTFPNRPLYGIGFSMGANILSNYIGEEGVNCQLKAAIVVSNPWNLEASSLFLQRSYIGLELYSRTMGGNLKRLFGVHENILMQDSRIDKEEVRKVKYLHEFDRAIQCPTWGYPTEYAYYRDASSSDSVTAFRIPVLALNAEDDPITGSEGLPRLEFAQSPYGVMCTTSLGGHLGWFKLGGERWYVDATTAFFNKMHREVDFKGEPRQYQVEEQKEDEKGAAKYRFEAMRRRMHIPEEQPARPYGNY